jgi:multidrug efflux pump subunit AcrA (membrane-fusion protein)
MKSFSKKSIFFFLFLSGFTACAVPAQPAEGGAAAGPGDQPREFTIPVDRQQMIGVTYATAGIKPLRRTLRAVGIVATTTAGHWDGVARLDGYVHKLYVSAPGDRVEKGQVLLDLDVAREGKAEPYFPLTSPIAGVVEEIAVPQGRHVAAGDLLIGIADLSAVWVWADFYESELPLLKPGLAVAITGAAVPGLAIAARISAVDPFLNDAKRTGRVRIDLDNRELQLRPNAYVDVTVALDEGTGLTIPFDAVLPTGEHNLVFIDRGAGRLEPREVELGEKFGEDYQVIGGLRAGERVVSSANFLVDAESKVQGALKSW